MLIFFKSFVSFLRCEGAGIGSVVYNHEKDAAIGYTSMFVMLTVQCKDEQTRKLWYMHFNITVLQVWFDLSRIQQNCQYVT